MSALSDFLTNATAPWWSVPASTILGTGLGGLISFRSAKRTAETNQQAQDRRDAREQVREIAVRLLNEANALAVSSQNLKETAGGLREVFEAAVQGRPPEEIRAKLSTLSLSGIGAGGKAGLLLNLLRMSGTLEEDLTRLMTILNELQLVADEDTAQKAVRLTYAALARKVVGPGPKELVKAANAAYETASVEFVNAARAYAGLPAQTAGIRLDQDELRAMLNFPTKPSSPEEQQEQQ
ncbi:hypothetical protein [Mycolicibacterium hippocampi]|uniref:Uncharacterized protein n=1 Tax=Mycolicibacterium hippocampi TaxID=659824 RepID=A0A850PMV7_9MYCO|nr:hypothetical protein [Mycolicibacterium hippocampi]NVN51701.1 hypothetical protein [Mycolicibacterium hippocampi]